MYEIEVTVRVEIGAAACGVVQETVVCTFVTKAVNRVTPQQVTHGAIRGWLVETINLTSINCHFDITQPLLAVN